MDIDDSLYLKKDSPHWYDMEGELHTPFKIGTLFVVVGIDNFGVTFAYNGTKFHSDVDYLARYFCVGLKGLRKHKLQLIEKIGK